MHCSAAALARNAKFVCSFTNFTCLNDIRLRPRNFIVGLLVSKSPSVIR